MALPGGRRRDIPPATADEIAEDRAAARRGDHMGPRDLSWLADLREDVDARGMDARWGA